uniref:Uncharacterized protein n=1 Tax=Heterosigma akashiwo TaxID=2829 RepID=A0A6V1LJA2_HETAK|mmetsp:Transcript_25435/g.46175  ORF Transcript_25435/g.46175 Transcript_25435/m.46175 type:complete len:201 (+) Transcript_25435:93-695(+)
MIKIIPLSAVCVSLLLSSALAFMPKGDLKSTGGKYLVKSHLGENEDYVEPENILRKSYQLVVNDDNFKFVQEAEIKHARISMLAMTGIFVQELYQLDEAYFPSKNFLEAFITAPVLGIIQIFFFIRAIEIRTSNFQDRAPGDLGFDPLNLAQYDQEKNWRKTEMRLGRIAMLGFITAIMQQSMTPLPIIEQDFTWVKNLL